MAPSLRLGPDARAGLARDNIAGMESNSERSADLTRG